MMIPGDPTSTQNVNYGLRDNFPPLRGAEFVKTRTLALPFRGRHDFGYDAMIGDRWLTALSATSLIEPDIFKS